MSSPRIAFHFLPGDLPLSNGISAIPDLDDVLFGPMTHDLPSRDASLDAFPANAPPAFSWDFSLDSVEDIFADLHEMCARRAPPHPLALPEREFIPFYPEDDEVPTFAFAARTALDRQAATLQASRLSRAAHEAEDSDDSDSDDSDDSDDDLCGALYSDFEERTICPLPSRAIVQPSTVLTASRTSSPLSSPTPAPASGRGRKTACPASAPPTLKRTAKRAKGPRLAKRRASTNSDSSSSSCLSATALAIASLVDENLPPPPNRAGVPPSFWPLLHLGCKVTSSGRGMVCYEEDCRHITGNFADMSRHVLKHNPQCRIPCTGCPQSFSRSDAFERHMRTKGPEHVTAAREAFLATFETLPSIMEMRAECNLDDTKARGRLNKELEYMFEELWDRSA
ncbi:hypothetical protein K438DRAFT_2019767 [Mycena galopus ATCC 62051]|nr:hypothetical protein K438DRAFT_2019767 [Mycena galopus ATCC 62051]